MALSTALDSTAQLLTQFEIERLEKMKRNQEKMRELGVHSQFAKLNEHVSSVSTHRACPPPRAALPPVQLEEPPL
jgi:hypothetical protein